MDRFPVVRPNTSRVVSSGYAWRHALDASTLKKGWRLAALISVLPVLSNMVVLWAFKKDDAMKVAIVTTLVTWAALAVVVAGEVLVRRLVAPGEILADRLVEATRTYGDLETRIERLELLAPDFIGAVLSPLTTRPGMFDLLVDVSIREYVSFPEAWELDLKLAIGQRVTGIPGRVYIPMAFHHPVGTYQVTVSFPYGANVPGIGALAKAAITRLTTEDSRGRTVKLKARGGVALVMTPADDESSAIAARSIRYAVECDRYENLTTILRDVSDANALYTQAQAWWNDVNSRLFPLMQEHERIKLRELYDHPQAWKRSSFVPQGTYDETTDRWVGPDVPTTPIPIPTAHKLAVSVSALHGVKNQLESWMRRDGDA